MTGCTHMYTRYVLAAKVHPRYVLSSEEYSIVDKLVHSVKVALEYALKNSEVLYRELGGFYIWSLIDAYKVTHDDRALASAAKLADQAASENVIDGSLVLSLFKLF